MIIWQWFSIWFPNYSWMHCRDYSRGDVKHSVLGLLNKNNIRERHLMWAKIVLCLRTVQDFITERLMISGEMNLWRTCVKTWQRINNSVATDMSASGYDWEIKWTIFIIQCFCVGAICTKKICIIKSQWMYSIESHCFWWYL